MARKLKRKRKHKGETPWQKHFGEIAHKCSELARKGEIDYHECMRKYL